MWSELTNSTPYKVAPISLFHLVIHLKCVLLLRRNRDPCHCHTKRRLGWHQPTKAFFWYDTYYRIVLCCLQRSYFIGGGVIPIEGLARLVPNKPSFGMTTTKNLRPVFTERSSNVFPYSLLNVTSSWLGNAFVSSIGCLFIITWFCGCRWTPIPGWPATTQPRGYKTTPYTTFV